MSVYFKCNMVVHYCEEPPISTEYLIWEWRRFSEHFKNLMDVFWWPRVYSVSRNDNPVFSTCMTITGLVTRVTRRVLLVEQEPLILPEHPSLHPGSLLGSCSSIYINYPLSFFLLVIILLSFNLRLLIILLFYLQTILLVLLNLAGNIMKYAV